MVTASPVGPNTTSSSNRSPGDLSSVTLRLPLPRAPPPRPSHAVPAQPLVGIGQLAGVLDEETGAAHELVRLLGEDTLGPFGAVVGLHDLLVLGFLLLDDETLLQDLVQAGLDILVVDLLLVLFPLLRTNANAM